MRFERRLVLACGVIAAGGLGLWTAPRAAAQAGRTDPDHVLPAGFVHPAIKK